MRDKRGFSKKSCGLCLICLLVTGIVALSLGLAIPTWLKPDELQPLRLEANMSLARILANMDTTQDPCQDFYAFACGGFIKKTDIPDESFQASTNEDIQNTIKMQVRELLEEPAGSLDLEAFIKAKDFYASCMDVDKIETMGSEPLKKVLSDVGGWPVLQGADRTPTHEDLPDLLSALTKRGIVADYLFQFGTMKNIYDETKFTLYIAPPTKLGLPITWYLAKNSPIVELYYQMMVEIATHLGARNDVAEKDMTAVLNFEFAIANLTATSLTGKVYEPLKAGELSFSNEKVNWPEVLGRLFPQVINDNASFLVRDHSYFQKLRDLIAKTPQRILTNYFLWRLVLINVRYLDKGTSGPRFRFESLLSGVESELPRTRFCSEDTLFFMDVAITAMYVRKYASPDRMKAASQLIDKISNEFQASLLAMKWMDPLSMVTARQKVGVMKKMIALPEEYWEDYTIEEFYQSLNISKTNGSFLDNALSVKFSAHLRNIMLLERSVDSDSWTEYSDMIADSGPSYSILQNAIKVPMTFLQGVYFEPSNQKYLNFGAIGSVIGHEYFHAVDLKGGTFNKDGVKEDWWSKTTTKNFYNQSECYVTQYDNYVIPEINETVSGVKTVAENLADHVGVKLSYKAYGHWFARFGPEIPPDGIGYSSTQLFWLSYANMYCSKTRVEAMRQIMATDIHAPQRFRVNGPLSNMPEFGRDFKCPVGSPMTPFVKCSII